jgi:hypothetical protein
MTIGRHQGEVRGGVVQRTVEAEGEGDARAALQLVGAGWTSTIAADTGGAAAFARSATTEARRSIASTISQFGSR